MADGSQAAVEVRWQDRNITQAVVRVTVEDHDRLIDEARVVIDDSSSIGCLNLRPGTKLEVKFGWGDTLTKIFEGFIANDRGSIENERGMVTVIAYDPSKAMHATPRAHNFTPGLKLSDIVKKVVADGRYEGFTVKDVDCDPDPTFPAHEVPLSLGRTDWQYLQELASVWGARCFVEVNNDANEFYFKSIKKLWAAAPLAKLHHCRGGYGSVMEFKYERTASRAARQLVGVGFDAQTGQSPRQEGAAPSPPAPATGNLSPDLARAEPGLAAVNQEAAAAAATTTPRPPMPLEVLGLPSDPTRAAAMVVTDPTQVIGYRGVARVMGNEGLRAKGRVELEGMAPWAEGNWWVKRATHKWWRSRDARNNPTASYETELEVTR